jgi:hypothetical protein
MKEVFLPISRDKRYEVSNLGRIRIAKSGKLRILQDHAGGYIRISLRCGVTCSVHTLVADAHLPRPDNLERKLIDHIDGNKHNNRADNLRWVTPRENTVAHYELSNKRLSVTMYDIAGKKVATYPTVQNCIEANNSLSLTAQIISRICRGQGSPFRGYTFQYEQPLRQRYNPPLHDDEEWKDIGTFEGNAFKTYQKSSYGLLRNSRGMFLTPVENSGYLSYQLKCNGQKIEIRAHRLVAHGFCPGRTEERGIVHHKDENRKNNHYKNLAWCTQQENAHFSTAKRVDQLTLEGVWVATYNSMTAAAEAVGVKKSGCICNCCSGKKKTAHGFKWRHA